MGIVWVCMGGTVRRASTHQTGHGSGCPLLYAYMCLTIYTYKTALLRLTWVYSLWLELILIAPHSMRVAVTTGAFLSFFFVFSTDTEEILFIYVCAAPDAHDTVRRLLRCSDLVECGGGKQGDAALVESVRLLAGGYGQAHREQQLRAGAVQVHRQRQRLPCLDRLRPTGKQITAMSLNPLCLSRTCVTKFIVCIQWGKYNV